MFYQKIKIQERRQNKQEKVPDIKAEMNHHIHTSPRRAFTNILSFEEAADTTRSELICQ